MPRWARWPALTILLLLALHPAVAIAAEDGERLYQVHCLACHGESGKGDGPMRDQLDLAIPDLTTIAARNDGDFPADKVHQIIDGRYETPAHGTRKMPVWGIAFQSTGRDTVQESAVQEMVTALTQYLESLQVKPGLQTDTDASKD